MAEVLEGADYTSNYATGLRLALRYNLILTQTKHVRQGPHLVEHDLLVDLRPLETREVVPAKMLLFLSSENGRWEESHPCPYLPSSNQIRDEFGEPEMTPCHILFMHCLPSWYEGKLLQAESVPNVQHSIVGDSFKWNKTLYTE